MATPSSSEWTSSQAAASISESLHANGDNGAAGLVVATPTQHTDTLTLLTRALSPPFPLTVWRSVRQASQSRHASPQEWSSLEPLATAAGAASGRHGTLQVHSQHASIQVCTALPLPNHSPNHVLPLLTTSVLLFVVQPPRHSIAAATSATSTASTATAQAQQWLPDLRPSSQCQRGCSGRSSGSL